MERERQTGHDMTALGLDDLPVKPRMRGWIHAWSLVVAILASAVLVSLAFTAEGPRAGIATLVYGVTVCGLFAVSTTYHRIHWHTFAPGRG